MKRRVFLAAFFLPVLGCRRTRTASARQCRECRRPVHSESRTVALVGGRKGVFCCPSCALAAKQQRGQPVQIVEFSDYHDGWKMDPLHAYLVRDSNVNPCFHKQGVVDVNKRVSALHYDRCAPGVLAFRSRLAAEEFVARHGGAIIRVGELR